jgi:CBS domain-containing protein
MTNIDSFIQAYNQLDLFMRQKLNHDMSISHSKLLSQMAKVDTVFAHLETKLQAYRALRNAIVHIHHEGETPIAMPNAEVVSDYRKIVSYALSPPLAIDSIAIIKIYSVNWDTKITEVNALMEEKGLSLIPIIHEGKMEGLFTSWFFQKYLFGHHFQVNAQTVLREMYGQFNLQHSASKINHDFRIGFEKSNANIEEVITCFLDSAKNGHYYKAVYLTENGKPFEQVLGVITPHCLPSINPKLVNQRLNI